MYGAPGWTPVAGDWTGSGHMGIGVYDESTGTWYLRNKVGQGPPDAGQFAFGGPGFRPVVGDWNNDGKTTIGVFDTTGTWYLRNSNSGGAPDISPFAYGASGWNPVAGDYDGLASLFAAGGPLTGAQPAALTQSRLQAFSTQVLGVLAQDGVSSAVRARLGAVQFQVATLGNGLVGLTQGASKQILIDPTAAGYGWFVDPTPGTSEEFDASGNALAGSPAAGRMDLLTVVLHELGHFMGHEDLNPDLYPDQLMSGTLAAGVRHAVLDKVFADM
jgi:hypothetical protein